MTADAIYAAVAVGFLLLACLVAWQLVLTLQQARRTALAMEQLLLGARPRIETATEQLGSFISRANRLLDTVEQRWGSASSFATGFGHALNGLRIGTEIAATLSAIVAVVSKAWSSLWRPAVEPEAREATGGATHA